MSKEVCTTQTKINGKTEHPDLEQSNPVFSLDILVYDKLPPN